ncbi:MAG TPA: ADP-ribose pyrophosphatase, partial [Achromobacter sp.]|nr:ADP-ribose pyrophosphatase [Achromobacter sp.]
MTRPTDTHLVETLVTSEAPYEGSFLKIRRDTVSLPNGNTATR